MVGVALILAFVVGTQVGRSCEPESPAQPQCEPVETVREQIVYRCEPDAGTEAGDPPAPADGVEPKRPGQGTRALPPAPPPITPKERKRLLAWVRDQSKDLDGCRTAAKETYRLTVTLVLSETGTIKRVRFNAAELPSSVAACLRERMVQWQPPADLVKDRPELVFGLTL